MLLAACGDDAASDDGSEDTGATTASTPATGDDTDTPATTDTQDTTGGEETAADTTSGNDDDTDSESESDSDTDTAEVCAEALGLFADDTCETLADGIVPFAPQYILWSDGLAKERFVYLPPDSTIDVSDADVWDFPVGTIFWKHFISQEGVFLETRRFEKTIDTRGPDGWTFATYVWNEEGDDVEAVVNGAENVLGSDHDIPSVADCTQCHSGGASGMTMGPGPMQDELTDVPLGFSAIQLNHDGSDTTLSSLDADGWLDGTVSTTDAVMPGDATATEALGYLHANCGHCHGGSSPAGGMTLWVDVGTATVEESTTYQNTVDVPTGEAPGMGLEDLPDLRIAPGDPENSALPWRMSRRTMDDAPMPPLATEVVDDDGVDAVEAWITSLGG
ncbi:MAG: hypothetical protein AAF799_01775 [Myxococcota bacterium]